MGWWPIDPATGMPVEDASSSLSQPPDFVLLNAVPGVDDDAEVSYLGDGPWDMASTLPAELAAAMGGPLTWSAEEIQGLFLEDRIPAGAEGKADELRAIVSAMWRDVDSCYEDDWERPSNASEKKWVLQYAIDSMKRRSAP